MARESATVDNDLPPIDHKSGAKRRLPVRRDVIAASAGIWEKAGAEDGSMDFFKASAAELGRAISLGKADPAELEEAFLERIDASDPDRQIYARTTPERAIAEAAASSERARAGRRRTLLDGVPVSWKDLFDTQGVATESGSRLLQGRVPAQDAQLLSIASEAGMVCLGKTHQTELAFSGLGVNPVTATPPNKGMPGHAPGGSSSGAAASLAHGLAALAMGSDTGGSVRIPAAWNNLAGLKITWGMLPDAGMVPLCPSFDTPGPLARTVEDLAIAFDILKGGTGHAAFTPAANVSGLRFHVAETIVLDDCDPEIRAAFETAVEQLSKAGARITRGPVDAFAPTAAIGPKLYPFEAWREWGSRIEAEGDKMFEPVRRRFSQGKSVTAGEYEAARREMTLLRAQYLDATETVDAVLMPTVAILPPRVDALLADPDYFTARNLLALRNTRFANTLGLCAVTLPLPERACGLQMLGKPFGDTRLLSIAGAAERVLAG
jgi:aspartyl-tRNA(Asn)/glutamyl-tRNA(Gln) amidotransferase subunit A